jgi:hypothetical protein
MNLRDDLKYLAEGIPQLEAYLRSGELYYPLGGGLPQLTLGGILLSQARTGAQAARFEPLLERVRAKWEAAWEAKAERERRARGALWMNYLAEYREDPKAAVLSYAYHVRYRAMIGLLGEAAHESDRFLRSVFAEGGFIWEAECAQRFPRAAFWFLFGRIKE